MTDSSRGRPDRGRFIRQTYDEIVRTLAAFETLLNRHGISVPAGSRLETYMLEMIGLAGDWQQQIEDPTVDPRPELIKCCGLADLVTKIVAVGNHQEFAKLVPHIQLLLNDSQFLQNYFSAQGDDASNKVFELYLASLVMAFAENVEFDDPVRSSGGRNPDVMALIQGRRWAFACKVVNGSNTILNYKDLLKHGVKQLERSNAECGIVVFNLKNVLNHEMFWPIERDAQGHIHEHVFADWREVHARQHEWFMAEIHGQIVEALGGSDEIREYWKDARIALPHTLNLVPATARCRDGENSPATKVNAFFPLHFASPSDELNAVLDQLNHAAQHTAEHAVRRDVG